MEGEKMNLAAQVLGRWGTIYSMIDPSDAPDLSICPPGKARTPRAPHTSQQGIRGKLKVMSELSQEEQIQPDT
jgi:hypothetical protein